MYCDYMGILILIKRATIYIYVYFIYEKRRRTRRKRRRRNGFKVEFLIPDKTCFPRWAKTCWPQPRPVLPSSGQLVTSSSGNSTLIGRRSRGQTCASRCIPVWQPCCTWCRGQVATLRPSQPAWRGRGTSGATTTTSELLSAIFQSPLRLLTTVREPVISVVVVK